MPNQSDNAPIIRDIEDSSVENFLRDQSMEAVSFRFSVDSTYHREKLPRVNASTDSVQIPHDLFLDLLFLYRESEGESPHRILHVQNRRWDQNIREHLRPLLNFPVPYVGYDVGVDICWLLLLGACAPEKIWDIRIAQRAMTLGRINSKARADGIRGSLQWIDSHQQWRQEAQSTLDLTSIAASNKIRCGVKPITLILLEIYLAQETEAEALQMLNHLVEVEMPWALVNAELGYNGIAIDISSQQQLIRHALAARDRIATDLQEMGVHNPRSQHDLTSYFARHNVLDLFKNAAGKVSFSDDLLEIHQDSSPAIDMVRQYRKTDSICATQISVSEHLTPAVRVHPVHVQLGTETGRQTSYRPNILGFDRIQRNLVISSPGYGIAEVDYSQHEVGIAAGLFDDDELIRMYNSGGVYSQIAQQFYAGSSLVQAGAESWSPQRFRQVYPELRENMKVGTLSVLYGQGAHGLAQRLGIEPMEARSFLKNFFQMFPAVHRAMTIGVAESLRRGYVEAVNGLRIALDSHRSVDQWTRERMAKNYPVQASGAVVFKSAGVRLFEAFQQHQARLLVPMHDAFIFESPLENLQEVIQLTSRIMISEMERYFPRLEPRVNVNCATPQHWSKEGYKNALEDFLNPHR